MDKTAWIVVTICAIGLIFMYTRTADQVAAQQKLIAEQRAAEAAANPKESAEGDASAANSSVPRAAEIVEAPRVEPNLPLEQQRLENEEAHYQFTTVGGGIDTVTLLNHRAFPEGRVILNEHGKAPIGGIVGRDNLPITPIHFQASTAADGSITYTGKDEFDIQFTKKFSQGKDPFMIDLEITFKNVGATSQEKTNYFVHTGALTLLHKKEMPLYMRYNWCNNAEVDQIATNWFKGGGFVFKKSAKDLFEKSLDSMQWSGPSNQFYTSLVIPDQTGPARIWGRRTPVVLADDQTKNINTHYALYGAVSVPEVRLAPDGEVTHKFQLYTGPRELKRLESLGHELPEIMHYDDMPLLGGMFGLIPLISTTLLKLMIWLAAMTKNWGIAILIITCLIRCLIWPLHAKSTRTMKKMAKLGPIMNELKEKHADDPQKMQQETMKLYRDYGVNPVGGCLPVLLQLPIFLGFYKMLQSAVELRDQNFLWVKDLAMPDTIYQFQNFSLFGVSSINLMPLLMAVTMIIQMRVGPKAGDKMQQRIFLFMPVIFLFICYNFASALALYWTGQNIFSIGQTWWMNKRPEPELVKRPPRKRMSLEDMKRPSGGQKPKKNKKRPPRTGG
jgi:YidC/Oxa1 family membrane protein insertase